MWLKFPPVFKADLPLKQMPRVWKLTQDGIIFMKAGKALKKEPKKTKAFCFSRVGLRSHGAPTCDLAWGPAPAWTGAGRGAEGACLKPHGPQASAPFQVIGAPANPPWPCRRCAVGDSGTLLSSFSTRDWRKQGQRRAGRRGKGETNSEDENRKTKTCLQSNALPMER